MPVRRRGCGEPAEQVAGHDLVRGNLKARMRMAAQYAVAGAHGLLVVGTDHAAEAVMGFFTKYGDGACDLAPLAGLTKRRVRAIAQALGAEDAIVAKVPTADLESEPPGLPDEDVFGVSYERIDDFLEGAKCRRRCTRSSSPPTAARAQAHAAAAPPPADSRKR